MRLPRWDHETRGWMAPALFAGMAAVFLATTSDVALLTRRSYIFVGGPLFLLAGLHARLNGFLHATARSQLSPLPVSPKHHWGAGQRLHASGLVQTGILGILGILAGGLAGQMPTPEAFALAGDFTLLWIHACLCEPLIPAACAWLGRRFAPESPLAVAQRQLSGGWSAPEVAIHLYAPALGLALAAALAMPGQLSLAQLDGGTPLAGIHVQLLAIPLALALGLRLLAKHVYARGFFESVAHLHESVRTLAGPPTARPVPGWLLALAGRKSAATRVALTLTARLTPALTLRLLLLLGWVIVAALTQLPGIAMAALGTAATAVWAQPFRAAFAGLARFYRAVPGVPLPPVAWAQARRALWWTCLAPPVAAGICVAFAWSNR